MNVMLINPETRSNARNGGIPLGIIAIATYLIPLGHKIRIVDRTLKRINIDTELSQFRPDIVGLSVVGSKSSPDAIKLSKKLKKLGYPVVWGGPFSACCPEQLLKEGLADYVMSGEGELCWAELLEALDGTHQRKVEDIDGIYSIIDNRIHYNGMHELGDLSTFPQMDFSLVNPADYFQSSFGCKKMLHICAAKGCPNHCTFCYNPAFNLSKYRKRPLEQVFNEITYLHDNFGMDGIYFTDELFANTKQDLEEYCNEFLSRNLDVKWGCQTTPGRFSQEDYMLMYKAGCRWVFFGIESGSMNSLRSMGKKNCLDDVEKSVIYCREAGIVTICAFIVGLPGETEEDLRATTEFAKRIPASYFNMNYYGPLPGSPMCNKLIKEGRYKSDIKVKEYYKAKYVEKVQKGICDIPSIDLKVIQNSFMWHSLTGTGLMEIDSKKAVQFFFKVAKEAIESMFNHGIVNFFCQLFYDADMVLSLMFYGFCFPTIRKKYRILHLKKK